MPPVIKNPAGYDISHHKEVLDFKLVDPKPIFFVTKATEAHPGTGYIHTDEKFVRFATGMMEIEVVRGFYHFNRKAFDAVRQAQHFVSIISQIDILPTDVLILDIEEGGEKASQLWAWHDYVESRYPDNMRMNYSRKNILDPIPMLLGFLGLAPQHVLNDIQMTLAEREYFKKIITWAAGYPTFPDLFSTIPNGYKADTSKFGPTLMWQYSAHGLVTGIHGDVDLNLLDPLLVALLGSNEVTQKEQIMLKGKCTQLAKTFVVPGGPNLNRDIQPGTDIEGSGTQVVASEKYIRLTKPFAAWSKDKWFSYTVVPDAPPPPPPDVPPPAPTKEIVKSTLLWSDGSTEDLFPVPKP